MAGAAGAAAAAGSSRPARALATGKAPLAQQTLADIRTLTGAGPSIAKVRAAIERLRRGGLVHKGPAGPATAADPLLGDYVRSMDSRGVLNA